MTALPGNYGPLGPVGGDKPVGFTPNGVPDHIVAEIKDFSMLDERVRRGREEQRRTSRETDAEDFRAVAPPVLSFASGRRR